MAAATKGPDAAGKTIYWRVDPKEARVMTVKDSIKIVCNGNTNEMFVMTTGLMHIQNPRLTGEGDLGQKYLTAKKKEICTDDRTKANFSFGIGIGDLGSDKIRAKYPTLKADQKECLAKIHQICTAILESTFDARPRDFLEIIVEHEGDALRAETQRLMDKGEPGIRSERDVLQRQEQDPELKARIKARAKAMFVQKARKFEDPAGYDEDGNRQNPDGTNRRIAYYLKKKVWGRKKEYAKCKFSEMPQKKKFKEPGFEFDRRENWPAILAEMGTHYEYHPVVFRKALNGMDIPRPRITLAGRGGEKITVPNPWWSAIPENMQALASVKIMFGLYTVSDTGYGVKIIPVSPITISDLAPSARGGADTTGYEEQAEDFAVDTEDVDETVPAPSGTTKRSAEDAPTGSKRVKTEEDAKPVEESYPAEADENDYE